MKLICCPCFIQDIAVVPFLVLLPFVETNDLGGQSTMSLVYQLGPTALKTLGSLAALLVVGRLVMRRLFELVAESRSDETFISLCLLTVTGAGLLTQKLGLSDTLGLPLARSNQSVDCISTQLYTQIAASYFCCLHIALHRDSVLLCLVLLFPCCPAFLSDILPAIKQQLVSISTTGDRYNHGSLSVQPLVMLLWSNTTSCQWLHSVQVTWCVPAGAFSAGVLLAETNYRTQVRQPPHLPICTVTCTLIVLLQSTMRQHALACHPYTHA